MQRVFETDFFYERYETQARANIQREQTLLQA